MDFVLSACVQAALIKNMCVQVNVSQNMITNEESIDQPGESEKNGK